MTFIQGIIRPEKVWLCSDKRLSSLDGRFYDDKNVKILSIHCPDGVCLIAYTGLATLSDGTKVPDWIRSTIRGINRSVIDTLKFITIRANKDIADRYGLVFIIIVCNKNSISLYQITNLQDRFSSWDKPNKLFLISKLEPLPNPLYFCAGSGMAYVTQKEKDDLLHIINNKPREKKEYINLLFQFNEKISQKNSQHVSPSAVAAILSSEGELVSTTSYKVDKDDFMSPPIVLSGIDLTDLIKFQTLEFHKAVENNANSFPKDFDSQIEIIAKRSLIPRK